MYILVFYTKLVCVHVCVCVCVCVFNKLRQQSKIVYKLFIQLTQTCTNGFHLPMHLNLFVQLYITMQKKTICVDFICDFYTTSLVAGAVAKCLKSKKAYNRWMVAYTLVRNTQLQTLTASHLHSKPDFNDADTCAIMDGPDIFSSVEYKASENPYTTYPGVVGSQDPSNFA